MKRSILGLALLVIGCGGTADNRAVMFETEGDTIPAPLGSAMGNAERGARIFVDRNTGHCVLCHAMEGLDAEFQGNVGPRLDDLASRLTPEQIRLRIADISLINPDTIMPPYYRTSDLRQVGTEFQGLSVLSSQDIEDLVSYLSDPPR